MTTQQITAANRLLPMPTYRTDVRGAHHRLDGKALTNDDYHKIAAIDKLQQQTYGEHISMRVRRSRVVATVKQEGSGYYLGNLRMRLHNGWANILDPNSYYINGVNLRVNSSLIRKYESDCKAERRVKREAAAGRKAEREAVAMGYKSHAARVKAEAKVAKKQAILQAKESAKSAAKRVKQTAKAKTELIKKLQNGDREVIVYQAKWLDYLNGNGHAYRGAAVCKALPVAKITTDVVMTAGGMVYVNGQGKRKLNLTNYMTGEVLRADYNI